MRRYITALACLAAFFSVAASASEIDYQLSFTGAGVDGNLLVSTDGVLNGSGAYTIDAVSGVRNGVTVDGLLPAGNYPTDSGYCGLSICWVLQSDNNFLAGAPFLDSLGLSYSVGGGADHVNLYYDNGTYYDLTQSANGANCNGLAACSYLGTPVTLSVTAVPEAGTLTLLATGLVGLGFALARRRRARRIAAR